MDFNKLDKIVATVYEATKSKKLVWSLHGSIFNSDTSHRYCAKSPDGVTTFECTISLDSDLKLQPHIFNYSMHISNPSMIDGGYHIHSNKHSLIEDIHRWIYVNHVLPSLKVANQNTVMDNILKGIDAPEYIDKKINDLLKSESSKMESPIITSKEKKTLFQKIFKRK